MQRKSKVKRIKMFWNMVVSVFLGNVGVIGCTSKVIVSIKQLWLCVSSIDFLISQIIITWDTYAILRYFSHTTRKILCYFWYIHFCVFIFFEKLFLSSSTTSRQILMDSYLLGPLDCFSRQILMHLQSIEAFWNFSQ